VLVRICYTSFHAFAKNDLKRHANHIAKTYRKDFDSGTGLDHCSKNGTKILTSSKFFAGGNRDL